MSQSNTHLIEEWKMLRHEIDEKQRFVERLVISTAAGNLAIFSFASSLQGLAPMNAFVALLPIILTTMSYFWILRNIYSGFRIAKYIKDAIEPQTSFNWETWINKSRKKTDPGGKPRKGTDFFGVYYHSLLGIALLICIILIWAPLWPYGSSAAQATSGAAQPTPTPIVAYVALSICAVVFWTVWYFLARNLFVVQTREGIQRLAKGMQDSD